MLNLKLQLESELESQLSALRAVTRSLLSEDGKTERRRLLDRQDRIILTLIPQVKAKQRREREDRGNTPQLPAVFPLGFQGTAETGYTFSPLSYMVGDDIFWNTYPRIEGKGDTMARATLNFRKNIGVRLQVTHGRHVTVTLTSKEDYAKAQRYKNENTIYQ